MNRLFLGALALALAACTPDDTGDGDTDRNYTRTAVTDGGTWTVSYTPDPDPIPISENFEVDATVAGAGLEGLELVWDARMPAHGHGMNTQAQVTANGAGSFHVVGMQLHMTGHWRMTADVSDGQVVETAIFDVECCQ